MMMVSHLSGYREAMRYQLKNEYGALLIEPKDLAFSEAIKDKLSQVKDAYFICHNANLLDEKDEPIIYDGKPLFFENQDIHLTFIPLTNNRHNYSLLIKGIEQVHSKIIKNQTFLVGSVNFRNAVGFTDISIRDMTEERDIINLKAEIFPLKIDYKTDFTSMLNEVTEIIYNLAFDYFKKTYLHTTPIDTTNKTLSEWAIILKHLFNALVKNIDLILRNPHYKIETTKTVREVSHVRKVDRKIEKWIIKNRKYLGKEGSAFRIKENIYLTHLPESRKILSYDTFENQFFVWAIKQIVNKIDEMSAHLKKLVSNSRRKELIFEIEVLGDYKTKLINRLSDQFLNNVSEFNSQFHFSTVLTMAPGYKEFYGSFLLLKRGLALSAKHIFNLDLKDISLLYEYWCFLKIIKILKNNNKYELIGNDFIKLEHNKFVVELKKGGESRVEFLKKDASESISIFYNKPFRKTGYSVTYTQKPDNFIEFKKEGYTTPFWYFFDAKYRFDDGKQEDYPDTEIKNGPPQDAIGQMHRYRDAILKGTANNQNYSSAIKSLGGIILFPFPGNEDSYREHPFYKSIKEVNIGAIPLHPGSGNKLFEIFLDDLFSKTPETLFETVIDFDRSEYFSFLEDIKSPVLIALIPNDLHYKKRIDFHFKKLLYHTRFTRKHDLDSNQNIFKAKYLALYSQKQKAIIGYAKIEEIKYIAVEELKKAGASWDHKDKEYLLFTLSDLKECNVHFSGMKQVARRYTNYLCFKQFLYKKVAEVILNLNNFEIIRLWKEIKNIDPECRIKRGQYILDKDLQDISRLEILFKHKGIDCTCLQDRNNRSVFSINGKEYSLTNNLMEFLNYSA